MIYRVFCTKIFSYTLRQPKAASYLETLLQASPPCQIFWLQSCLWIWCTSFYTKTTRRWGRVRCLQLNITSMVNLGKFQLELVGLSDKIHNSTWNFSFFQTAFPMFSKGNTVWKIFTECQLKVQVHTLNEVSTPKQCGKVHDRSNCNTLQQCNWLYKASPFISSIFYFQENEPEAMVEGGLRL